MPDFPPVTESSVRSMMFGLAPSIQKDPASIFASDQYAAEVREFRDYFNARRPHWLALTDDSDLLDDLLSSWQILEEHQVVARACLLRLISQVPGMPTFPWDRRDAQPLPSSELFHMDREAALTRHAWKLYLSVKAWLRDPTVVSEIAATWEDSPTAGWVSPNLHLIYGLASSATESAVELLRDRWTNCASDGDRKAAQLELCLLRQPGISPPRMTDLEVERSGVAMLAHSLRLGTPHPVLLRYLQADNMCHHWLRSECLRRPHIRKLCRGPGDWSRNLVHHFSFPQNDLPE